MSRPPPTSSARRAPRRSRTRAVVIAIIRPANTQEVQECVRIANRFTVPLYPISTGRNWGYGSRSPVRDAVILDLGRLNKIIDLNEDLAYVTRRAGRHAAAALRPAARARVEAVDGRHRLESRLQHHRQHARAGLRAHADGRPLRATRVASKSCSPPASASRPASAAFGNPRTASVSRWGIGPSLDGLFAQSNFGIVTRMTMWLMPAPEHYCAFFFQSESRSRRDLSMRCGRCACDGTLPQRRAHRQRLQDAFEQRSISLE